MRKEGGIVSSLGSSVHLHFVLRRAKSIHIDEIIYNGGHLLKEWLAREAKESLISWLPVHSDLKYIFYSIGTL